MGYARYAIYRRGEKIDAGYDVPDVCNRRWCRARIDRGLDCLCGRHPGGDEYGCGGYFCSRHRYSVPINGDIYDLCKDCLRIQERQRAEEFTEQLAELVEAMDGVEKTVVFDDGISLVVEFVNDDEIVVQIPISEPPRPVRLPALLRSLVRMRTSWSVRG